MIKNTKQIFIREPYEAPSCEVLRLKSEGVICSSPIHIGSVMDLEDATYDNWGTL